MKFVLPKDAPRLGKLTEFQRCPDLIVETPVCMLHTKAGSVPHLCRDVLGKLSNLPKIISMYFSCFVNHQDVISECELGLPEFTSFKDKVVFCGSHEVTTPITKFDCTNNKTMCVRALAGIERVNPQQYCQAENSFRADMTQVLGDLDINAEIATSDSRMIKSVKRSSEYLENVLLQRDASYGAPLFASVGGGLIVSQRIQSAQAASSHPVNGFVVEGFHDYGPSTELFWDEPKHRDALNASIECLPREKPRMVNGMLHPVAMLDLLKLGVDMIDSSYTYMVTDRGGALSFPYKHDQTESPPADRMYELNLNDTKYVDQFTPLLDSCECYCCKGFTRGYIHHLLRTNELLAGVLLNLHNLHHYLQFFDVVRSTLDDIESLDKLRAKLAKYRGEPVTSVNS